MTRAFLTFVSIVSCCLGTSTRSEAGIFFGGHQNTGIRTANFDGTGLTKVANASSSQDVAVDVTGGQLFWSNLSAGIYRSDIDGTNASQLFATTGLAWGLAVDVAERHLYWAETDNGTIRRMNFDGSNQVTIVSGLDAPREIEIDAAAGLLYWVENGVGAIRRSDLSGDNQVDLITGLPTGNLGVTGLGLDLVHGQIYWAEDASTESIGRANLDGTAQEVFYQHTSPGTGQPVSVAVDPLGGYVYWSDFTPNAVHRMKIDGTGFETILNVTRPSGIVVARAAAPEPASLAIWSVLGLVSAGAEWRKRRHAGGGLNC